MPLCREQRSDPLARLILIGRCRDGAGARTVGPPDLLEETNAMALARYEVRVNGRLSERARSAFCAMNVTSVPPQTIVFGDLGEVTDLADLLALCNAMGLEVVSVRRLPSAAAIATGTATADNAVLGIRSEPGRHSAAGIADTEDTHPVDQRWSGPQPDSL